MIKNLKKVVFRHVQRQTRETRKRNVRNLVQYSRKCFLIEILMYVHKKTFSVVENF